MNKQTRKDYDDVYKAMSNDTDARHRLIDRGLIPANAKLVDLYHLEATLADKLTTSGDNYVEVLAARAEEELPNPPRNRQQSGERVNRR